MSSDRNSYYYEPFWSVKMVPKVLFISHAKNIQGVCVCGQNFGNKRHLNSQTEMEDVSTQKPHRTWVILGLSDQILGLYESQVKRYSKKWFGKKGKVNWVYNSSVYKGPILYISFKGLFLLYLFPMLPFIYTLTSIKKDLRQVLKASRIN